MTVGIDFQKVLPEPILGGSDGKLSNVKISHERRSVTDHETHGSITDWRSSQDTKLLLPFWQSQKEGKDKEIKTPKFLVVSRAAIYWFRVAAAHDRLATPEFGRLQQKEGKRMTPGNLKKWFLTSLFAFAIIPLHNFKRLSSRAS